MSVEQLSAGLWPDAALRIVRAATARSGAAGRERGGGVIPIMDDPLDGGRHRIVRFYREYISATLAMLMGASIS